MLTHIFDQTSNLVESNQILNNRSDWILDLAQIATKIEILSLHSNQFHDSRLLIWFIIFIKALNIRGVSDLEIGLYIKSHNIWIQLI